MRMQRVPVWMAVLWIGLWGVTATGQVEVSARLQHARVLQFEPILATVRIENRTPRPITVGPGEEVELGFDISRRPGDFLSRRPDARLQDPFSIQPGESFSMVINLLDQYPLTRLGPYTVQARLSFGGRSQPTSRMFLDVVPGMKLRRVEGSLDGQLSGARRVCTLLSLSREGREFLFLRFDDPDAEICYGVHDLGTYIGFTAPSLATDLMGQVHVLHQSASTRFTHSVFRVNGLPVDRAFYTKGAAQIRLEARDEGELAVVGGLPYSGDLSVQMPTLPAILPAR